MKYNAYKNEFWNEKEAKELFQILPFYNVEIRNTKDPLAQLEASKSSIDNLFKDLLNEMKGFKYQITVTVLLCKHIKNGDLRVCSYLFQFCN